VGDAASVQKTFLKVESFVIEVDIFFIIIRSQFNSKTNNSGFWGFGVFGFWGKSIVKLIVSYFN